RYADAVQCSHLRPSETATRVELASPVTDVCGRQEDGGGKAVPVEDGERMRGEILETVVKRQHDSRVGGLCVRFDIFHGLIELQGAVACLAKEVHLLRKDSGRRGGFEIRMQPV